MFLVSWRLEPCESGITVSGLSRSRDHLDDLIGDIVGALLSAILLKMAIISWMVRSCLLCHGRVPNTTV